MSLNADKKLITIWTDLGFWYNEEGFPAAVDPNWVLHGL